MSSEVRKARRGLIGGFRVVSGGVGCEVRDLEVAMPTRALSSCCVLADSGKNGAKQRRVATREVAGECGNRTHPTLRGKVTVILKITEATRLHPPPRVSMNFDRNFSPFDDLADEHGSGNA